MHMHITLLGLSSGNPLERQVDLIFGSKLASVFDVEFMEINVSDFTHVSHFLQFLENYFENVLNGDTTCLGIEMNCDRFDASEIIAKRAIYTF